jgi:hypothetical protein
MEPQPLGAFYGRSCHNLQVFSRSLAGSHRSRGHIIRIGDFLRGRRVGHLLDRSRLAGAARSKVDICEQLTKEPILTTMVAIPKPRQKLRLSRFRNSENVEVCLC